jgi:radical SAM superfamily enzyme YgiQ (UPF0313 family)
MDLGAGMKVDRPTVPPLGPLYLAAALLDAGYEVRFVDFGAEPYSENRVRQLLEGQDVIGVSIMACDRQASYQVIGDVRKVAPDAPIVVGGHDSLLMTEVPQNADVAVWGEADHTIVQIVEAAVSGRGLSDCPGVLYRERTTGEVRRGRPSTVPQDLDGLMVPARHLTDRGRYTFLGRGQRGRIASIVTSRGCPYRCTYCAERSTAQWGYRERSAESVLAEIAGIHGAGYRYVVIVDNNFFVNRARVEAIMDGIVEHGMRIGIIVQGRVDLVDEGLMRKMKEAGLCILTCGFESGCQDVLDFYKKGTTVEQNREIIRLADKYGIYTFGNFMLGAPFEGREHIQRTIDFVMESPLDAAKFSMLWYIHGSTLWDEAHQEGLVGWDEQYVLATSERKLGQFSQAEMEEICSRATRGFYMRPNYWMRQVRKAMEVGRHDSGLVIGLWGSVCRALVQGRLGLSS